MLSSIDLNELPRGPLDASRELNDCGATFNGDLAPVTLLQEFCSAFSLDYHTHARGGRVSADLGFEGTQLWSASWDIPHAHTYRALVRTYLVATRMRDILRNRGLLPGPITWVPASWLNVRQQGYTTSHLYNYHGIYSLNRILITDPRNIRAFAWDEEGVGHTCEVPVLTRRSTFGQLAVILANGSPR